MVYMGSKARIVGEFKSYIQDCINDNRIDTYIEPFVGGANVITEIECSNRTGYDKSKPLIALLNALRDDPACNFAPKDVDSEYYKQMRNEYLHPTGAHSEAYVAAAGYFSSYAGRFFDGGFARSGEGSKRNHYQERLRNAQKHALKFKGIEFIQGDYTKAVSESVSGAFIYCDPPYAGTKQYGYGNEDFNYVKFYDWLINLGKRNYVLISEYYMPSDFRLVWKQPLLVSLAQNRTQATIKSECLFTPNGGLYDQWQQKFSDNFALRG